MYNFLALILSNPFGFILIVLALSGLGSGIYQIIQEWANRRHEYNMKLLDVRKIEALSNMISSSSDKEKQFLLEQIPDWIDKNDFKEVEDFLEARKEVVDSASGLPLR